MNLKPIFLLMVIVTTIGAGRHYLTTSPPPAHKSDTSMMQLFPETPSKTGGESVASAVQLPREKTQEDTSLKLLRTLEELGFSPEVAKEAQEEFKRYAESRAQERAHVLEMPLTLPAEIMDKLPLEIQEQILSR